MTELFWAAKRGDLAAVDVELSTGASMADTGSESLKDGWNALAYGAASTNCSDDVFDGLLERTLVADAFFKKPATGIALHKAAKSGAIRKVAALLRAGADPKMAGNLGSHMLDSLIYFATPDHVACLSAILSAYSPGDVDLKVLAMVVRQGTRWGSRKGLEAVYHYGGANLRRHLEDEMGVVVAGIALGKGIAALDLGPLDDFQCALQMAIALDELEVVQKLLTRSATVDQRYDFLALGTQSETGKWDFGAEIEPYLYAAAGGDAVRCLAWLLENGANPNGLGSYGEPALLPAASRGFARATRILIEAGASLTWAGGRFLLETGASITLDGGPIIADAAGAAIPVLLDAGADVDAIGEDGYWALITAIESGDLQLARELLDRGAKVDNCCQGLDITALHMALQREEAHIALLLLERGADPNIRDLDGESPLDCARSNYMREKLLAVGATSGRR